MPSNKMPRADNNSISLDGQKADNIIKVCILFSIFGNITRCIPSVITKRKEGIFEDKRENKQQILDAKNDIFTTFNPFPRLIATTRGLISKKSILYAARA